MAWTIGLYKAQTLFVYTPGHMLTGTTRYSTVWLTVNKRGPSWLGDSLPFSLSADPQSPYSRCPNPPPPPRIGEVKYSKKYQQFFLNISTNALYFYSHTKPGAM